MGTFEVDQSSTDRHSLTLDLDANIRDSPQSPGNGGDNITQNVDIVENADLSVPIDMMALYNLQPRPVSLIENTATSTSIAQKEGCKVSSK